MKELFDDVRKKQELARFERDIELQKEFGNDFETYWYYLKNKHLVRTNAPRS